MTSSQRSDGLSRALRKWEQPRSSWSQEFPSSELDYNTWLVCAWVQRRRKHEWNALVLRDERLRNELGVWVLCAGRGGGACSVARSTTLLPASRFPRPPHAHLTLIFKEEMYNRQSIACFSHYDGIVIKKCRLCKTRKNYIPMESFFSNNSSLLYYITITFFFK